GGRAPTATEIPVEYRDQLGRVSIARTVPQLKAFAEAGGVLVAFGGSAVLGHHLGLPVSDHLVEVAQDGSERPLPGTKYYIPGSILSVTVDNTNPVAFGLDQKLDVFFDNNPVMELAPKRTKDHLMVVNLSGRGDKDVPQVGDILRGKSK
ncbi:hypothetical protein, partial [uncultured Bradyrhizobium sp.]|uniref:hypothetical protein n=1 Tax=uncultured Bradyrhizobium sp. TaxID=199684 RepID=UPI00262F8C52